MIHLMSHIGPLDYMIVSNIGYMERPKEKRAAPQTLLCPMRSIDL